MCTFIILFFRGASYTLVSIVGAGVRRVRKSLGFYTFFKISFVDKKKAKRETKTAHERAAYLEEEDNKEEDKPGVKSLLLLFRPSAFISSASLPSLLLNIVQKICVIHPP